jgi:hypothetical protein
LRSALRFSGRPSRLRNLCKGGAFAYEQRETRDEKPETSSQLTPDSDNLTGALPGKSLLSCFITVGVSAGQEATSVQSLEESLKWQSGDYQRTISHPAAGLVGLLFAWKIFPFLYVPLNSFLRQALF